MSSSIVPSSIDPHRAALAIEEFLTAVGAPLHSDPELAQTGARVAQSFAEDLLSGYRMDPQQILADCTAATSSGMVVVTQLSTAILCPHHLMPAIGTVHVAYLPSSKVVGFGALAKLVKCYARRLILQEEFVRRVAESLHTELGSRGSACVADLRSTCLSARGPQQHQAHTITSAYTGELLDNLELRREFLQQIRPTDD